MDGSMTKDTAKMNEANRETSVSEEIIQTSSKHLFLHLFYFSHTIINT